MAARHSTPQESCFRVIKAPHSLPAELDSIPSVFLAGTCGPVSIPSSNSPVDWRTCLTTSLQSHFSTPSSVGKSLYVLNPLRLDWDSFTESPSDSAFQAQLTWELEARERSAVHVFYFGEGSGGAVSLLEMGCSLGQLQEGGLVGGLTKVGAGEAVKAVEENSKDKTVLREYRGFYDKETGSWTGTWDPCEPWEQLAAKAPAGSEAKVWRGTWRDGVPPPSAPPAPGDPTWDGTRGSWFERRTGRDEAAWPLTTNKLVAEEEKEKVGWRHKSIKLIVCCHPNYFKRGNVILTCKRYGVEVFEDWRDLTAKVLEALRELEQ